MSSSTWSVFAPVPALLLGIGAMKQLGVPTRVWAMNVVAAAVGLVFWVLIRRMPRTARPALFVAIGSMVLLLLPFASEGMRGVHRWLSLGGFRVHAAAIVAPLLIFCVAVLARRRFVVAAAIASLGTIVIALQPDAAQATSLAAACAVMFLPEVRTHRRAAAGALVLLLAAASVSFVRHDPLPPVRHVEEIFQVVAANGAAWLILGTLSLLLLPLPFLAAWARTRDPLALALGVYVALTTLAPLWGTFPVPVMGYGISPIAGYFLALSLRDTT